MVEGIVLVVFGLLFGSSALFGIAVSGNPCFGAKGHRTLRISSGAALFLALLLIALGATKAIDSQWL